MEEFIFTNYLQAILKRIQEVMPKEVHVFVCPSDFDEKQLQICSKKAPAIGISLLKVIGVNHNRGRAAAEVRVGIYLITSVRKDKSPDEIALNILPRLLNSVYGENWNVDFTENRPEQIEADNLYSGNLANTGFLALYGVSFRQRLLLPDLQDFTQPDSYPKQPDGTSNLNYNKISYPWNDPITEFLRTNATHKENSILANGIFNVRNEKGNTHE